MKSICIYFFILLSYQAFSQKESYSVNCQDENLENVLKKLEKEHDLLFTYMLSEVEDVKVSASVLSSNISDVLEILLKQTNLEFEIENDRFVIIRPAPPKTNQTLCGYVYDSLTGDPLEYANAFVEGTNIGSSTDEKGYFELNGPVGEDQKVNISYVGFDKQSMTVGSFAKTGCMDFKLEFAEITTSFLIIKDYITDGIDLDENGSATVMRPKRTGALAGQAEPDVLRSIQFLPGIANASSKASDLYIRGGTPDQNLLNWENIPIYHSAHYFGMITAIDPFTIEKMKVYRGGFGAEYGGRISGVVDMKSGDERSRDTYLGAGSNMTHAYVYGLQKLGKKETTAVSFSLRRSYSEWWESPSFTNITKVNQQGFILGDQEVDILPDNLTIKNDFNFIDSHIKVASSIGKSDRLEISMLYADNNFSDEIIESNQKVTQIDSMDLSNFGLSANWEHNWSENWSSQLKLINTNYIIDYNYKFKEFNEDKPRFSGVKENSIQDRQLVLSNLFTTKRNQIITAGYHLLDYDVNYRVIQDAPGPDTNEKGDAQSRLHSVYASMKNPISQSLGYNVGLRSSYYEINEKIYLEPRIRLSYAFGERYSMSLNYGRHHQVVSQLTEFKGNNNGLGIALWALAESENTDVQRSDILQWGSIYQHNDWVIDLQVYRKIVTGLSSRSYDLEDVGGGSSLKGMATTNGMDVLIKKRWRSLRSWISYSLSRTDFEFERIRPSSFPSDFDQLHNFQWANQWVRNQWTIGLGFRASSGLPYTELIDFTNDAPPNQELDLDLEYAPLNSSRLDWIQELNASVQYTYIPKTAYWKAFFSVSVTNILNNTNTYNRSYYVDTPSGQSPRIDFTEKTNLPITPFANIRIEW